MQMEFKLEGLSGHGQAEMIERGVAALPHVRNAFVGLVTKTLKVSLDETYQAQVVAALIKHVKAVNPAINVTECIKADEPEEETETPKEAKGKKSAKKKPKNISDALKITLSILRAASALTLAVIIALVSLPFPLELSVSVGACILAGAPLVLKGIKQLFRGQVFREEFLVSAAAVGALSIGFFAEGVIILSIYTIGEIFKELLSARSMSSVSSLDELKTDIAFIKTSVGSIVKTRPQDLKKGDTIIIRSGERVPLDGVVTSGSITVDMRGLTGDNEPRERKEGDYCISGCICTDGLAELHVTTEYKDSTAMRIIDLTHSAAASGSELAFERPVKLFSMVVVLGALVIALLPPLLKMGTYPEYIYRALGLLIAAGPVALTFSMPFSILKGIITCSRIGALVKNGSSIFSLSTAHTAVFDKTGVLTDGIFRVTKAEPAEGVSRTEFLGTLNAALAISDHPMAKVITAYCGEKSEAQAVITTEDEDGIMAMLNGIPIMVGTALYASEHGFPIEENTEDEISLGTGIYTICDHKLMGVIHLTDIIRDSAPDMLDSLTREGISDFYMITGDKESPAHAVSEALGLNGYYSSLTLAEKAEMYKLIKEEKPGSTVLFVGDGINDQTVFDIADAGVVMGGTDEARKSADAVLIHDNLEALPGLLAISKRTRSLIYTNLCIAAAVKAVIVILAVLGLPVWAAVSADLLACVLTGIIAIYVKGYVPSA